jgi:nitroreductase
MNNQITVVRDRWSRMLHASPDDAARSRIAFLRGLRAVRQLRPDPLPADVLDDILEVARWSGSAGNR